MPTLTYGNSGAGKWSASGVAEWLNGVNGAAYRRVVLLPTGPVQRVQFEVAKDLANMTLLVTLVSSQSYLRSRGVLGFSCDGGGGLASMFFRSTPFPTSCALFNPLEFDFAH